MSIDERTYPIETTVSVVYEGLDCAEGLDPFWAAQGLEKENSRILAAFEHSLGRGWGSGVFNFMGDESQVCDDVGRPARLSRD